MATKSFYTLEEAAKRLNMSTAEINKIADTGKLQRVHHEGEAKIRFEQVEILASNRAGSAAPSPDMIPLDDTGATIGLADSSAGSAIGMTSKRAPAPNPLDDSVLGLADSTPRGAPSPFDSSEQTGISALSGKGRAGRGDSVEIGLETVGSGSGLLDLTRESEETALGAELIDQVYSGDGEAQAGASGFFDAVTNDSSLGAAAPVSAAGMVMSEPYDGAWSGVGTGVLIAAFASIVVAGVIAVSVSMGAGSAVASSFSGNILAWAGSLAGITAVFGLVGFFVGKASE